MNISQLEDVTEAVNKVQQAFVDHGITPEPGYAFTVNVSDGTGKGSDVRLSVRLEDRSDWSSWYLDAKEL